MPTRRCTIAFWLMEAISAGQTATHASPRINADVEYFHSEVVSIWNDDDNGQGDTTIQQLLPAAVGARVGQYVRQRGKQPFDISKTVDFLRSFDIIGGKNDLFTPVSFMSMHSINICCSYWFYTDK